MLRKGGKSTSIVSGVRRKVHTTFEDGREMVEEYDTVTDELCTRKVRTAKSALGREGTWVYEVGEEPKALSAETGTIAESGSNPQFSRLDTVDCFQWRVRNLPYPESTYNITIDPTDNKFVIRTTNKKYYKRFGVPEMDALKRKLDPADFSWYHRNNALVISYTKPDEVLASEREDKVREKVFRIDRPENTAALCVPFILNRKYIGTVSIYNCPFSLTSLKQVQRQKMRSQNQEQDGDIDCKQQ